MASFIRQLNMYGFRKVSNIDSGGLKFEGDEIEFYHQHFNRDKEDELPLIKRKLSNTNNNNTTSIVKLDQYHNILSDVESMKDRQESVDSLLSSMKRENEALWREVAILRQKHLKQQQIVEKLLHFLVNIVRNQVVTTTGIKRKAPLMIDSSDNRKILKPNALDSVGNASSPGPIISDITDLEEGDLSLLDFELMKGNDSENGNALRNDVTNVLPGDFQGDFQGDLQGEIQSEVLSNEVSDVLQNEVPASTEVQGDFLPIEIQGDSTEQLLNDQDSVLNTPVISADQGIVASPNTNQSIVPINFAPMDPSINSNENFLNAGFDAGSPSTSTELIVPNQPTLAQLSPETFDNHLEGIDDELHWLYEQINNSDIKLDPGIFGVDN